MRQRQAPLWVCTLLLVLTACASAPEPEPAPPQAAPAEAPVTEAPPPGAYAGWSAVVAAGDNRAGNGNPTFAFDNARRDVALRLEALGFSRTEMIRLTADPYRQPGPESPPGTEHGTQAKLKRASVTRLRQDLALIKQRTTQGCLFYLTSHGDRSGLVFGSGTLSPAAFWAAVEDFCGTQPVIAVISACHSGNFAAPQHHAPNRYIFTAAHADRTSFGCGEDDVYPFFDACFLTESESARDWIDLAGRITACVERKEAALELTPSQPQFFVGEDIRTRITAKPFAPPAR